MRALITSDIHVTSRPSDEYRWEIFRWLKEHKQREHADCVFILGDLTDEKDRHKADLVNRLVDEIQRLGHVYFLVGNHDYIDPSTPYFKFLRSAGVRVFTKPTRLTIGEAKVLFLPHTTDTERWCKLPRKMWKGNDLACMHLTVRGAQFSNGEVCDKEGPVDHKFLDALGYPIVSGDVHVPQTLGSVTYCGSPHPVHFGDNFDPRVLLFDSATGKLASIRHRTISKRQLTIYSYAELVTMWKKDALQKDDQVQLTVALPREALYEWPKTQQRIREFCEKRGILLHSIDPKELDGGSTTVTDNVNVTQDTPLVAFKRLARSQDTPKDLRAWGEKILKGCQSNERPSCGDFKLRSVQMTGFKRYGATQILRFKGPPGLYFLSGRNADEPRLGSNGVGKSTILDGIRWCFSGKTMRDQRGPIVKHWGEDGKCQVSVDFSNDSGRCVVERTQGPPNKLELVDLDDGAKSTVITDDEVPKRLGLTDEEFGFIALSGQFGSTFLDLGDTARLDIFSKALGLDAWESAADEADKHATAASKKIVEVQKTLDEIKIGVELRAKDLAAERAKPIDDASNVEELLAIAQKNLDKVTARIKLMEKERVRLDEDLKPLSEKARDARECVGESSTKISILSARKSSLTNQLEAARRAECQACKRPFPKNEIKEQVKRISKQLDDLCAELAPIQKNHNDLLQALRAAESLHDKTQADAREIGDRLFNTKERVAAMDGVAQLRGVLDGIKLQEKARQERIEILEKSIRRTAAGRKAAKLERKTHQIELAAAEYWIKQFKQFRFLLVKEAQTFLSISTTAALERMGLIGWSVRYECERETTTGNISRGFFIYIKSPDSPELVPLESWCGGETQRLRNATIVAIADFFSARRGCKPSDEWFDEPTAHLSAEGVADLADFLRDRAHTEKRRIWIIDHRTPEYGDFQAEYRVVRKGGQSRIVRVHVKDGE